MGTFDYFRYRDAVLVSIGLFASISCELFVASAKVLSEKEVKSYSPLSCRWLLLFCLQAPMLYLFFLLESKKDEACDMVSLITQAYQVVSAFQLVSLVGYTISITRHCPANVLAQNGSATLASSQVLFIFFAAIGYQVCCMCLNYVESERDTPSFLVAAKTLICIMTLNVFAICCYFGYQWLWKSSADKKDDTLVGVCLSMLLLRLVSVAAITLSQDPYIKSEKLVSSLVQLCASTCICSPSQR